VTYIKKTTHPLTQPFVTPPKLRNFAGAVIEMWGVKTVPKKGACVKGVFVVWKTKPSRVKWHLLHATLGGGGGGGLSDATWGAGSEYRAYDMCSLFVCHKSHRGIRRPARE